MSSFDLFVVFVIGFFLGAAAIIVIDSPSEFGPVSLVENGTTTYYPNARYVEHFLSSDIYYADLLIRENGTYAHRYLGSLRGINPVISFYSKGVRVVIVPEVV